VTSSNLTKILAVNWKQLSNNIIDPLFFGTYGLAVSRQSHSGQSIQIHVLQVLWHIRKTDFGILFRHKNGTVHRLPFHLHL
jgi:hypothetical protein